MRSLPLASDWSLTFAASGSGTGSITKELNVQTLALLSCLNLILCNGTNFWLASSELSVLLASVVSQRSMTSSNAIFQAGLMETLAGLERDLVVLNDAHERDSVLPLLNGLSKALSVCRAFCCI